MSTSQLEKLATELKIPDGVTVTYKRPMVIVQGPLGKTWKSFKKLYRSSKYKYNMVKKK